jgi:hypothetical protein
MTKSLENIADEILGSGPRSKKKDKYSPPKKNKDDTILTEEEKANKRKGRQQGSLRAGPWVRKYYSLNVELYDKSGEMLTKAPNQVKGMLKFMRENIEEIKESGGLQGGEIASRSINEGYIASKINPPAALFAYYRKLMESFGLILVEQGD